MPPTLEFARALHGVRRLLHWQQDGFSYFNATVGGFARSFWALPLTLPVFVLSVWDQRDVVQPKSDVHFFALEFLANVIGWLLYPLVMLRLCRFLGRGACYLTYMVAYNWFQVVQALAWLPLLVLSRVGGLPTESGGFFLLLTNLILFSYSWFIARCGLKIGTWTAVAIVIIDFLIGMLIDETVSRLV